MATVEDSSGTAHLGYVIPVELLPTEWLRYIFPGVKRDRGTIHDVRSFLVSLRREAESERVLEFG